MKENEKNSKTHRRMLRSKTLAKVDQMMADLWANDREALREMAKGNVVFNKDNALLIKKISSLILVIMSLDKAEAIEPPS